MAKSILDVNGIGPASAVLLKDAGITTADDLAVATVAQVVLVRGFSDIRAARVIEDAVKLLATAGAPDASGAKQTETPFLPKSSFDKKEKKDAKKKSDQKKTKKNSSKKKKDSPKGKNSKKMKDSKKGKDTKKGKKKK